MPRADSLRDYDALCRVDVRDEAGNRARRAKFFAGLPRDLAVDDEPQSTVGPVERGILPPVRRGIALYAGTGRSRELECELAEIHQAWARRAFFQWLALMAALTLAAVVLH